MARTDRRRTCRIQISTAEDRAADEARLILMELQAEPFLKRLEDLEERPAPIAAATRRRPISSLLAPGNCRRLWMSLTVISPFRR